jgi:hypothetical protein
MRTKRNDGTLQQPDARHGFDATTMYVADTGNFRIRAVNLIDGSVTTLAGSTKGQVDGTGAAAQFSLRVTVDPRRTSSTLPTRRDPGHPQTGVVTTLTGTTAGFDDGTGCTAKFGELRGIAYYAGALFAVDVNRVRKVKLP